MRLREPGRYPVLRPGIGEHVALSQATDLIEELAVGDLDGEGFGDGGVEAGDGGGVCGDGAVVC